MTVNWQGLADAVEPATAALDTMAQGVSGDELAAVDVLRDFYGKLHDAAANQDLNAFVELNGDTAALTSASAQIVEIAAQHCA
jgi:glutamine synthetase adenylyltransferase